VAQVLELVLVLQQVQVQPPPQQVLQQAQQALAPQELAQVQLPQARRKALCL
jgi:hypothetical protein